MKKLIRNLEDEKFVNVRKKSTRRSNLEISEDNDCVVHSFKSALGITYDQSHLFCKKVFNRVNRRGTEVLLHLDSLLRKTKNGYKFKLLGFHPDCIELRSTINPIKRKTVVYNPQYGDKKIGYTVKTFIETHPKGRYVLIVSHHAVGLVDGVLYGNVDEKYSGFKRRVHYAIECVPKNIQ